jgi:hypothetical protein
MASISDQAGGAGHGGQVITLSNTLKVGCMLYGFPGLGLLNSAGQPIPLTVARQSGTGIVFPAVPEKPVTIGPGQAASFGMEWVNGASAGTVSLEVTPPNDQAVLVIANQEDIFQGNDVSVTPIAPAGQITNSQGN